MTREAPVYREIEIRAIRIGENVRRRSASSSGLSATVGVLGVLNPITVQELDQGEYEVVTGARRVEAARSAGIEKIGALVRVVDAKKRVLHQLVENIQRENLHPLDEAEAVARLQSLTGESQQYVGRMLGKTESWMSSTLSLLRLRDDEKTLLRDNPDPPAKAVLEVAVQTKDPALRQQIIAGGMSKHDAAKMKRKVDRRLGGRPKHFHLSLSAARAVVSLRFRSSRVSRQDAIRALEEALAIVRDASRWPLRQAKAEGQP